MPEISRFLGIIISMNHSEHAPPHFHARYQGRDAQFSLESLSVLRGKLPPRVVGLILEWAELHQDELRENWDLARSKRPLKNIKPLE
jgi:hypothetical protein